jgi:aspartate kinase
VPDARRLAEVSFEEMAELAAYGARVLMLRSVEMGRRWRVPLHVRSSFHEGEGTWVRQEVAGAPALVGIAHDPTAVLVTLPTVAGAGGSPLLESAVAGAGLAPRLVGAGPDGVGVTVAEEQAAAAAAAVGPVAATLGAGEITVNQAVGEVSVVGALLRSDPEWAGRVSQILSGGGIPVLLSAGSAIRASCVVPGERLDEAVRLLHGRLFADPPKEEP